MKEYVVIVRRTSYVGFKIHAETPEQARQKYMNYPVEHRPDTVLGPAHHPTVEQFVETCENANVCPRVEELREEDWKRDRL